MHRVVTIILLFAAIHCRADDKSDFLNVQIEYVSELLTMGMPHFAQAHLDVIKKEFPTKNEDVTYYQAHIHFKQTKYAKAAKQLEALIKGKPSATRLKEARKLLTLAYLRTGKFDEAIKNFKLVQPFGGPKSWYAETCVELGETQARAFAKSPPAKRVELKKMGFTVLNAYQTQFPKNDQAPIILYYLAEFEYDVLAALLSDFGDSAKEASPQVREEKSKAIILQLHKARKIYQSIVDDHPKSSIVNRAKPRLASLSAVVEKMKRNEQ